MSYTPINWQNGDTITAEKMNKMDNGWSVNSTSVTCFEGNITTTAGELEKAFSPTVDFSDASEIIVTLNDTTYDLTGFDDGGWWTWGAPYGDFSEYSFSISTYNGSYLFISQAAGTYAIKIESLAKTTELSADFKAAVESASPPQTFLCVNGITTIDEAVAAKNSNKLLFFWTENSGCFFINDFDSQCVIYPESETVSAYFNRDGTFIVVEA